MPYKAVCVTQRGAAGRRGCRRGGWSEGRGTGRTHKAQSRKRHGGDGTGLGGTERQNVTVVKRILDLGETERKQLGSGLSDDAIIELRAEEEECERQGERLITMIIGQ